MPVKQTIPYDHGTFFITFTCYQWLPLIDKVNGYDIVYTWFDYLKTQGHFINVYVIMPNHVHVIISFTETRQSINTIIGNGKRFICKTGTKMIAVTQGPVPETLLRNRHLKQCDDVYKTA
jgi:putative transposase